MGKRERAAAAPDRSGASPSVPHPALECNRKGVSKAKKNGYLPTATVSERRTRAVHAARLSPERELAYLAKTFQFRRDCRRSLSSAQLPRTNGLWHSPFR